ncbi:MAG TPA: transcriptional regulator [Polyangia bacterium]|nr:transcriptional regulator [Polyangia bacterium]
MLQSSARLLRLLTFFQSRATWTGAELTERLEVTARTVRRDVDRLRALGYPVDSTTGPAGGYKLGPGAKLPPLMLDDEEGVAVAIALRDANDDVAGVSEAARRALAKIDQVLPARLRKRLGALRAAVVRAPGTTAGAKVELGVVDALAAACNEHRVASFGYRDQEGRATRRSVEPQRLVLSGRRWYLAAWDRAREDWRTFRVDRVVAPVELGVAFAPRPAPDDDVAGFVARATSWRRSPVQARVLFDAPVAKLRAKIPPAYGDLTPVGKKKCRLETGGTSLDGVAVWLAVTGVPFTVEAPQQLRAHMGVLGARLRKAWGRGP